MAMDADGRLVGRRSIVVGDREKNVLHRMRLRRPFHRGAIVAGGQRAVGGFPAKNVLRMLAGRVRGTRRACCIGVGTGQLEWKGILGRELPWGIGRLACRRRLANG